MGRQRGAFTYLHLALRRDAGGVGVARGAYRRPPGAIFRALLRGQTYCLGARDPFFVGRIEVLLRIRGTAFALAAYFCRQAMRYITRFRTLSGFGG